MRERWHLPFAIHADPGGVELLQPLDAWNPDERGGIGWPTTLLFDPQGEERLRHRGRDFADRPSDDPLSAAARQLGLPAISLDPAPAVAEPVEDDGAFRPDAYGAYFRGNRFAARALAGRLNGVEDRVEAKVHEAMAVGFLEAWSKRRKSVEEEPGRDGR